MQVVMFERGESLGDITMVVVEASDAFAAEAQARAALAQTEARR